MNESNTQNMPGLEEFLPGIKEKAQSVPDHHFYAAVGNMERLKQVIDESPHKINEADARGQVTLIWPIFTGQIEVVKYCLLAGADPFLKPQANSASPMEAAEIMHNVSEAHNEIYTIMQRASQNMFKFKEEEKVKSANAAR